MTIGPLHTIATALRPLHDDAYSPVRAASVEPIENNRWTADALYDNEHATTHPHLRRSKGPSKQPIPTGNRDAHRIYRRAVGIITDAYSALVPPAIRQAPRGPADQHTQPGDLVSMLAVIHQVLTRWTEQGARARDLEPVRVDHTRQLDQLAEDVQHWTRTWTPPKGHDVCTDPMNYRRCSGYPVVANRLCRPCYNRTAYLARKSG